MLVFFFQAEDGIRDLTVTGVQTCALPISFHWRRARRHERSSRQTYHEQANEYGDVAERIHAKTGGDPGAGDDHRDRKSTRLNSSHSQISYAVFCLKKKTTSSHTTSLTSVT